MNAAIAEGSSDRKITLIRRITKELYNEEDDEVKNAIALEVEAAKLVDLDGKTGAENSTRTPEEYQAYVLSLTSYCAVSNDFYFLQSDRRSSWIHT